MSSFAVEMFPVSVTMSNEISSFRQSRKSKQIEHVQFVWTLSKGRNFTISSFDIVAVFGSKVEWFHFVAKNDNKLECCFDKVERCSDIVAGVDGALGRITTPPSLRDYGSFCRCVWRHSDQWLTPSDWLLSFCCVYVRLTSRLLHKYPNIINWSRSN